MAATTQAAYNDLSVALEAQDLVQAVQIVQSLTEAQPTDPDAYQVLIACLVRLDKYQAALAAIQQAGRHGHQSFKFEKAYCQYRVSDLAGSLKTLDGLSKHSSGRLDAETQLACRKLYAQIHYRRGNYAEAMSIYESLMESVDRQSADYSDLLTNHTAVRVGLAYQQAADAKSADDSDSQPALIHKGTYELAYNSACFLICAHRYSEAEELLEVARETCERVLAENHASEAERESELAAIDIQLGHVYQLQGKVKAAEALYGRYLGTAATDAAAVALIAHNIAAYRGATGIFDTALKLRRKNVGQSDPRLLKEQLRIVAFNNTLLKFYLRQNPATRRDCRSHLRTYPNDPYLGILHAATWFQQGMAGQGVAELTQLVKDDHMATPVLVYSLVQAHLQMRQYTLALQVLDDYCAKNGDDTKYDPGMASVLLWLHDQLRQPDRAAKLVADLSTHWEKPGSPGQIPNALLKRRGLYYLHINQSRKAVSDFQQVVQRDPTNHHSTTALILALAQVDLDAAAPYESMLPAVPSLVDETQLDEIEGRLAAIRVRPVVKRQATARTSATRNKRRAKKLPKSQDPKAVVDPERWLPMVQRSYYKPSKSRRSAKNRKRGVGSTGPQGVVSHSEEGGLGGTGSANISGVAASRTPEPASPAPAAATPTKPQPTKNNRQTAKKKKKGGR
ncbi:Srp72p [Dimargaris cristalligena]|nr:Srp72p [Dimargaris cristalligena]